MAMAVRRTLTVSITPEQDALVRACLQTGRFASASEVVRAALRLLEREESSSGQTTPTTTAAQQVQDRA